MQSVRFIYDDNTYTFFLDDTFYFNGLLLKNYMTGELLISFYDIDLYKFVSIINKPFSAPITTKDDLEQQIEQWHDNLSEFFDPIITALMLNDIEKVLIEYSENQSLDYLNDELNGLFINFKLLKRVIEFYIDGKYEDVSAFISSIQHFEARYHLDRNNRILLELKTEYIYSLIAIEMANITANNKTIKICENCGKLFIPHNRSDEIYCDRIVKGKKTCKDIGYSEKEKKDPFKKEYTKARKTQHARIRYNSHIPDYKEKYYEPWRKAAEQARDHFKSMNDFDGFKKWLQDNKNYPKNTKGRDINGNEIT